jgi:hypothetical protein
MNDFKKLSIQEREHIFSKRIKSQFIIDRTTLSFETIEADLFDTDINNNFEVPPIIMDEKHLQQIIFYSGPELKGRWIRTAIRTYLEGGKVIYKKIDEDNFLATLIF